MFSLLVNDLIVEDVSAVDFAALAFDFSTVAVLRYRSDSKRYFIELYPLSLNADSNCISDQTAQSTNIPEVRKPGAAFETPFCGRGQVLSVAWQDSNTLYVHGSQGVWFLNTDPVRGYAVAELMERVGWPPLPESTPTQCDWFGPCWSYLCPAETLCALVLSSSKSGVFYTDPHSPNASYPPDDEKLLLIRGDDVRQSLWFQTDSVLCSMIVSNIGGGVFYGTILHRVPMNSNQRVTYGHIAEWACGARSVFVLDLEFGEVKHWSLQLSTSICIENIPVLPTVQRLFCTEDGLLLTAICTNGAIHCYDTSKALATAQTTSQSKQIKKTKKDPFKICAGLQLDNESSAETSWDGINRGISQQQLAFGRFQDLPQEVDVSSLVGMTVASQAMVVIGKTYAMCVFPKSDDERVASPTSPAPGGAAPVAVTERFDVVSPFCVVKLGRPPLPPHVVVLLLTQRGCRVILAGKKINKHTLLLNEILFGAFHQAARLSTLNGWEVRDVEEKNLEVALADGPSAVYRAMMDLLRRDANSTWPDTVLDLTCMLCNAVCAKYDNCPDDSNARRLLVGHTTAVLSFLSRPLLQHCVEKMPEVKRETLIKRITESTDERETSVGTPFSRINASGSSSCADDVTMIVCIINGMKEMRASINLGVPMSVKSSTFGWHVGRVGEYSFEQKGTRPRSRHARADSRPVQPTVE